MLIIKKLAQLVVAVILVTLFASLLLEFLPGDAADVLAPSASDQQREQIREDIGLHDSFPVRYTRWLGTS